MQRLKERSCAFGMKLNQAAKRNNGSTRFSYHQGTSDRHIGVIVEKTVKIMRILLSGK